MAFSTRLEAFRPSTRAIGIDLNRSVYKTNLGTYVANASTTFYAGMLVELNSSQEVIKSTGAAPFGFAKYNKANAYMATVVDEEIVMTGTSLIPLAHAPIWYPTGSANGIRVQNLAKTTTYTETTHYVVSYTNGTVQRVVVGGGMTDGQHVLVTYQYEVPTSALQFEGRNFWNFTDDVSIQGNKITVINDWSIIFTTQYDTHQVFAVNTKLYGGMTADSKEGLVCITGGAGSPVFIGTVFQVPTAADPFLGIRYVGGVAA